MAPRVRGPERAPLFPPGTEGNHSGMLNLARSLPLRPRSSARSDVVRSVARAAHDVGAAALLGGNLFARVAMHPVLGGLGSPRERGTATNRAWRRYGVVNSLGLGAILAGWGLARGAAAQTGRRDPVARCLARANDAAVAAVAVTGIAAAIEGLRFAGSAPGGAVPLVDGDTPSPDASSREARMKTVLRRLGGLNLAAEVALVTVNAALAQRDGHGPPLRGRLLR